MNAPVPNASASPANKTVTPGKKFDWGKEIRQWIWLILLVLGIHSFIAKPFYIPSESMLSTMLVGDRLVVSKFPYGYSYLSPSVPILPRMDGRLFGRLPERGDIIVIKSPADGADWIKRVVGLPGDMIEMRGGQLVLNGKPVPRTRIDDVVLRVVPGSLSDCAVNGFPQYRVEAPDGAAACRYPRYLEVLPSGRNYETLDLIEGGQNDDRPAVTVPEGYLFLMGDNRDNSSDSRVAPEIGGLGLVPVENIVGRAEFTTFSLDGSEVWWNPVSWLKALRGDRAFVNLHPAESPPAR